MKKMLKKSFALLLALVCVLNVESVIASAATLNGKCGKNVTWVLDSKGVLTIKGTGEMEDFGTADARPWGERREDIKKIVIKEGVTSVSYKAFSHLENLNDVEFPNTLVFVGSDIFYNSSYQAKADKYGVRYEDGILLEAASLDGEYKISKGTRVIADNAFNMADQSQLNGVKLPEGLVAIGKESFKDCKSIQSIKIPSSVKYFYEGAFDGCEGLKTVVIKNGVKSIDRTVFLNCFSLEAIAIPVSVTIIGDQAFAGCEKLKDIYYGGTTNQWDAITIKENNTELTHQENIHYINDDKKGDINADGRINSSDALLVLLYAVEKTELVPKQIAAADVATDCKINSSDALEILKISVGSTK